MPVEKGGSKELERPAVFLFVKEGGSDGGWEVDVGLEKQPSRIFPPAQAFTPPNAPEDGGDIGARGGNGGRGQSGEPQQTHWERGGKRRRHGPDWWLWAVCSVEGRRGVGSVVEMRKTCGASRYTACLVWTASIQLPGVSG